MQSIYAFIVLIIGCLLALQGAINAKLSSHLNHPFQAALFSFLVGTLSLLLINLGFNKPLPKWNIIRELPWYLWLGGLFGATMVSSAVLLIPRIGATTFIGSVIVGQLVAALIIDHFGILNVPQERITPLRLLGAASLVLGFVLIKK